MLPAILPGSHLTLRPYEPSERLGPGWVVVFPSGTGMVAHRVVAVSGTPPEQQVWVRGDAQVRTEVLRSAEIAYVVIAARRGSFRYRMNGAVGKLFAVLALRGGTASQRAAAAVRWLAARRPSSRR